MANAVLKATLYDNKQNNLYTNTVRATPVYADIVFNLCKMFEQSIDHDIKEGFAKSIVDSKERTKEYRKDTDDCKNPSWTSSIFCDMLCVSRR